jgi:hypothetical protein
MLQIITRYAQQNAIGSRAATHRRSLVIQHVEFACELMVSEIYH